MLVYIQLIMADKMSITEQVAVQRAAAQRAKLQTFGVAGGGAQSSWTSPSGEVLVIEKTPETKKLERVDEQGNVSLVVGQEDLKAVESSTTSSTQPVSEFFKQQTVKEIQDPYGWNRVGPVRPGPLRAENVHPSPNIEFGKSDINFSGLNTYPGQRTATFEEASEGIARRKYEKELRDETRTMQDTLASAPSSVVGSSALFTGLSGKTPEFFISSIISMFDKDYERTPGYLIAERAVEIKRAREKGGTFGMFLETTKGAAESLPFRMASSAFLGEFGFGPMTKSVSYFGGAMQEGFEIVGTNIGFSAIMKTGHDAAIDTQTGKWAKGIGRFGELGAEFYSFGGGFKRGFENPSWTLEPIGPGVRGVYLFTGKASKPRAGIIDGKLIRGEPSIFDLATLPEAEGGILLSGFQPRGKGETRLFTKEVFEMSGILSGEYTGKVASGIEFGKMYEKTKVPTPERFLLESSAMTPAEVQASTRIVMEDLPIESVYGSFASEPQKQLGLQREFGDIEVKVSLGLEERVIAGESAKSIIEAIGGSELSAEHLIGGSTIRKKVGGNEVNIFEIKSGPGDAPNYAWGFDLNKPTKLVVEGKPTDPLNQQFLRKLAASTIPSNKGKFAPLEHRELKDPFDLLSTGESLRRWDLDITGNVVKADKGTSLLTTMADSFKIDTKILQGNVKMELPMGKSITFGKPTTSPSAGGFSMTSILTGFTGTSFVSPSSSHSSPSPSADVFKLLPASKSSVDTLLGSLSPSKSSSPSSLFSLSPSSLGKSKSPSPSVSMSLSPSLSPSPSVSKSLSSSLSASLSPSMSSSPSSSPSLSSYGFSPSPSPYFIPDIGGGIGFPKRSKRVKGKRTYRYTPTVVGSLSGRTQTPTKDVGAQIMGIRYRAGTKKKTKVRKAKKKGKKMQSNMNKVLGMRLF